MDISLENIERILIEEDIEGLIEDGAPEDEYSSEAEDIAKALSEFTEEDINEDNVAKVISLIWAESFNLSDNELQQRLPAIRRVVQGVL